MQLLIHVDYVKIKILILFGTTYVRFAFCFYSKTIGFDLTELITYLEKLSKNLGYSLLYTALNMEAGAHPPGFTVVKDNQSVS